MDLNLDDPGFWLPPLFLSDESVTDFKNNTDFLFSDSNSGFSSPVDSSTETESDEDEFLTELTRRLTSSTHLSHHIWKPKPNHGLLPNGKADTSWKMPKSPQSTLCNEEVAKIARLEQDTPTVCLNVGAPAQKLESKTKKQAYHSNQRILYQPFNQNGNSNGRLSPSAWPCLQQSQSHKQPIPVPWSSAAILMNSNVPKRECSGTGVFLPMPRPTPRETPRKKQPDAAASNQRKGSQQRRDNLRSPATTNNEIRLPQEWTY